jgi:hypothetical protein
MRIQLRTTHINGISFQAISVEHNQATINTLDVEFQSNQLDHRSKIHFKPFFRQVDNSEKAHQ